MFNITNVDFTDHCSYLLFIYFIFIMKSTYELHFLFFGCYRCCSRCCCSCSWCYILLLFLSFFCLFVFLFLFVVVVVFFIKNKFWRGGRGMAKYFRLLQPVSRPWKGKWIRERGGGYQTVFEIWTKMYFLKTIGK